MVLSLGRKFGRPACLLGIPEYTTVERKENRMRICEGKDEVHSRTDHEGPEGEKRYSSTISLTSALDVGGGFNATPRPLYSGKDPVPNV